jgi:hypothetical protein
MLKAKRNEINEQGKEKILISRAKLPFSLMWCYHPRLKAPFCHIVTGGNTTRD